MPAHFPYATVNYELLGENADQSEPKLLLLLYRSWVLRKLCIETSYAHRFDLRVIYFHSSMSVSGWGCLGRRTLFCQAERTPGIYLSVSACWLTSEGRETLQVEVGRRTGRKELLFSSRPLVQLPNQDWSRLLSVESRDLSLLFAFLRISQPILMHSAFPNETHMS